MNTKTKISIMIGTALIFIVLIVLVARNVLIEDTTGFTIATTTAAHTQNAATPLESSSVVETTIITTTTKETETKLTTSSEPERKVTSTTTIRAAASREPQTPVDEWIQSEITTTTASETTTTTTVPKDETETETTTTTTYYWDGPVLTPQAGVVQGPSGKETYYNLDMSGVVNIMRGLGYDANSYPYWVRADGCKMLGEYIIVAADLSIRPRGTILPTSLGMGIVCDTGGFIYSDRYQLDIATSW